MTRYNQLSIILHVILCTGVVIGRISSINRMDKGQFSPSLYARTDYEGYFAASRDLQNMFVEPWGDVTKRPGTYYIATEPSVTTITDLYETTVDLTWFGSNGNIWAVHIDDGSISTLDVGGVAVDRGGGTVGLPYTGNLFQSGDPIYISGTSNYDGAHTLTSGTSATEIQFTDVFNAETFDGTERIVIKKTVSAGLGRLTGDTDGYIYYAHSWSAENQTFVTRYDRDLTASVDFLNHSWNGSDKPCSSCNVFAMQVTDGYLYIAWDHHDMLEKYELESGDLVWSVDAGLDNGYQLDVDSSGNVYMKGDRGYSSPDQILKFNSSDGSLGWYTDTAEVIEAAFMAGIRVDEDNDFIVTTGYQGTLDHEDDIYNIATWTMAGEFIAATAIDGTYIDGSFKYTYRLFCGYMDIYDGSIYCFQYDSQYSPGTTVYRLDSDLTIMAMAEGPTYGCGLFTDFFGNIVVINQDWTAAQSTIFYIYDSDTLALLGTFGDFWDGMLKTWCPAVGDVYTQGGVFQNITSAVVGTTTSTTVPYPYGAESPIRLINFESLTNQPYILELGHEYMRFYK